MTVFAFGDDHARATFARCANVTLHWFGPYSMHRVSQGGAFTTLQLVLPRLEQTQRGTLIYMVGAEDIRRRIFRRSIEEGREIPVLIEDLAEAYVHQVRCLPDLVGFPLQVGIVGVMPPVGPRWDDQTRPAVGDFQGRRAAREALNASLGIRCRERGVAFIEIPKIYETKRGALKPRLSDGQGHIAADHAHHVCAAVEHALGADLGHRRLSVIQRLARRYARIRAVRAGDAAALRQLGEILAEPNACMPGKAQR